jgi:hypothetical protein
MVTFIVISPRVVIVLVELGLVEQRYAVLAEPQ